MIRPRRPALDFDAAETIAFQGLAFLAEDAQRLGRFLTLTGIGPGDLRVHARDRGMLIAVVEYLLGDESLLLTFAAHARIDPVAVQAVHRILTGESD